MDSPPAATVAHISQSPPPPPPTQTQTRTTPATAKLVPKRKLSVFSHNGFPNIQLLEKQQQSQQAGSLKILAAGQDHREQAEIEAAPANRAAKEGQSTTTTTSNAAAIAKQQQESAESRQQTIGSPNVIIPEPVAGSNPAANQQQQQQQQHISSSATSAANLRLVRSDTLGSNASSRASSCDEPTISALDSSASSLSSSVSLEEQASSGSNSSRTAGERNQVGPKRHSFVAAAQPFESIKVQLEKQKNSKLDAQLIQQHIDKLISQNESIMENWSSISIRSYNSSRDWTPAPPTKRSSVCSATPATASEPGKRISSSSSSSSSVAASSSSRSSAGTSEINSSSLSSGSACSKRWSTAMLLGSSNHNINSRVQTNRAQTAQAGHHLQSQRLQQQAQPLSLAPLQSLASSGSSSRPSSPRAPPPMATTSTSLFGASPNFERLAARQQHQDPSHLESAIENLSLKRNEIPLASTHSSSSADGQSNMHSQLHSQQQNSTGNLGASNAPSRSYQQELEQQHQLQLQEEQEELKRREQDQQRAMLVAAILLDRQRQCSLAEKQALSLENQAATLRQQEQQRFQQQLAAALQHYPYEKQVAMMASLPTLLALQQEQLHRSSHQQLPASAVYPQAQQQHPLIGRAGGANSSELGESQLFSELLAKLRPCDEPTDQLRLMAHGAEMLTQSLDSATPSYRCDACDIPFWTRDLLSYHSLHQCSARVNQPQQPPPTFNFYGPNNFDRHYQQQQQQQQQQQFQMLAQRNLQLSKSVSPPRGGRSSCSQIGEPSKLFSCSASSSSSHQLQSFGPSPAIAAAEASSILKHQLSARQAVAAGTAEGAGLVALAAPPLADCKQLDEVQLPFKKRKISEPNMRY